MEPDDILFLATNQWERGFIVPQRCLRGALEQAIVDAKDRDWLEERPYQMSDGPAFCYRPSRQGWVRYSELTGKMIHLNDGTVIGQERWGPDGWQQHVFEL